MSCFKSPVGMSPMKRQETEEDTASDENSTCVSAQSKLGILISKQLDFTDSSPLNIYELKNYIYFGFSNAKLRPKYWKVLLNYYSQNQFKSEQFYRMSRQSYHEMVKNQNSGENGHEDTLKAINMDLSRTLMLQEQQIKAGVSYEEPIRRILSLYAGTNKDIGYVQGMINIVLVIYHVLVQSEDVEDVKYAEEDCFFMFNNLMSEIGSNFSQLCDDMPCGVTSQMEGIYEIVKERDPVLYDVMVTKNIVGSGLGMRWVLLLFSGEFSIDSTIWLWDRLFSDSYRFEMLGYCGASAIILMRNIIIKASFEKCMETFQSISMVDEQVMFYIADVMRREKCNIVEVIEKKANEPLEI
ncbi:TBC1 domain family member 13 [Pancytospora epiphaga]|nr:TBC1 domain family member 13 [Pancytospora epiphaga]